MTRFALSVALAYYTVSWEIEYATCALLLNYPDAPAPRGARLVPEVARGFPRVSGGGRVYTFTLKKTYRFSNGKRITAANYAAAINRTIVLRRNRFYRGPRPHGVGQIVFD
ncbi:MAG TPA: ABC transporter substrate-binding protein, partial [Gaiellaceae bacterium]|nr:ABC transporter substrate-binding protein [Gaiellaceae bacterium]